MDTEPWISHNFHMLKYCSSLGSFSNIKKCKNPLVQINGSQREAPEQPQRITLEWLEVQTLWSHLRPTESETPEVRPGTQWFNKPSRWFWYIINDLRITGLELCLSIIIRVWINWDLVILIGKSVPGHEILHFLRSSQVRSMLIPNSQMLPFV